MCSFVALEKISKKILFRAKNILFRNKLIILMLDNRMRVSHPGTPSGVCEQEVTKGQG